MNGKRRNRIFFRAIAWNVVCLLFVPVLLAQQVDDPPTKLFETYCFDCHDDTSQEGGLDLVRLLEQRVFDGTLIFEHLITEKMPPSDAGQPDDVERLQLLNWLARRQAASEPNFYRRISRHEFNHRVNDLLGIELELAHTIPDDRGTNDFDSDRRILLTKEMLAAYFSSADQMLEFAFPRNGFLPQKIWKTGKIKDSHHTYNIYTRPYQEGILFSWTRANNGNSYSFFYDNFEPPVSGWYELTFEAAKVGDFQEDVSLQVHAGKYYFADDRPQPQRLLDVISLGNQELKSYTIRGFLHPGESVSVHCFSKHNWREKNGNRGAYIKQLTARGPLTDDWPPPSYRQVFAGVTLNVPMRKTVEGMPGKTVLEQIGGTVSVSSFQEGMEQERMLDGSNRTFWHTRFKPTLAKPPHFVILKNPAAVEIKGLRYATWSGGNGNGQVKSYAIFVSDDEQHWGDPIAAGTLETRLAAEQPITFAEPTKKRFIKFLVKDAFSIDGRSLASIGKLDVMADVAEGHAKSRISVTSKSSEDLKRLIRRFAERAFCSSLTDEELAPYFEVSLRSLRQHGDFVAAAKLGMKAVVCSHRFLVAPGVHRNDSYRVAADLARTLWLSVPDRRLLELAKADQLSDDAIRHEIDRMLADEKAGRMIHSFCDQWLNLRSFKKVAPSLKLYPLYDDLLDHYLPLETEAYLHHLIVENRPVGQLIDSDFSFLNQRLAQHYGMDDVVGQQVRKVTLSPESPRGGLLTMASILKVTTDGFDTSPILRGAWISQNIAGNTLSPPPEVVKPIESDTSGATTLREQIELHKNSQACAACHKKIDPYGFALENFDATGQWRKEYRVKKPHKGTFQYRRAGYFTLGREVDASGQIGDEGFTNVAGLKKILLSDYKKVAYNFMKKFFEYANGYTPTLQQRIDLFQCIPDKAEECRMKDLLVEVLFQSFAGERK